MPSLHLIARTFPEAQRWMLTNSLISEKQVPLAEVLQYTGLINNYIHYHPNLKSPSKLLALIRRLRALHLDAIIYLAAPRGRLKILRDVIFFKICGIKRLIGVPYKKTLQNSKLLPNGNYEYEGSRLLRCIRPLGVTNLKNPFSFDLRLQHFEYERVESVLNEFDINCSFIVASIGTKLDVNDWGDDYWRELFSSLGKKLSKWGLAMVGSSDERERSSKLITYWPGKSINLCGNLNIRESGIVLSKAKLFIGHDSGPMHLAAAVNTPCIAIFSSRNLPGVWFPYGSHHRILYKHMVCMGCKFNVCKQFDKKCIRSITVSEVFYQVMQLAKNYTHNNS